MDTNEKEELVQLEKDVAELKKDIKTLTDTISAMSKSMDQLHKDNINTAKRLNKFREKVREYMLFGPLGDI